MNKLLLDPISKLIQIENNTTKQLNNLQAKKEFLHDFKSFLKNSDEGSLLIDRVKLKKIKNEINTKHQSIFEENNKSSYIPIENANLNKNLEFLNINNVYKLNCENLNFKSNENKTNANNNSNNLKKSGFISCQTINDHFVVCSKNSKNVKNLRLFDDIIKKETKNEFFEEAINIINTNSYLNTVGTKANTTKSIAVDTNSDFRYASKNNNNNYNNFNTISEVNNPQVCFEYEKAKAKVEAKDEDEVLKQTIQAIIQKEVLKHHKTGKNSNYSNNDNNNLENHNYKQKEKEKFEKKEVIFKEKNNHQFHLLTDNHKKSKKKLNCDIENILTNESILELIKNEKEKLKIRKSSSRNLKKANLENIKNNHNENKNNNKNKDSNENDIRGENVKSSPRYFERKINSPKIFYAKKLAESLTNDKINKNLNGNGNNVLINEIIDNSKEGLKTMKSSKQINFILTERYF